MSALILFKGHEIWREWATRQSGTSGTHDQTTNNVTLQSMHFQSSNSISLGKNTQEVEIIM